MASIARKLIPLGDRILVQRAMAKAQTTGGVFLPDSNKKKMNEATVVAVGPGARGKDGALIAPTVAIGDVVLMPEYGGSQVKLADDEFTLIRNEDILGKFQQ